MQVKLNLYLQRAIPDSWTKTKSTPSVYLMALHEQTGWEQNKLLLVLKQRTNKFSKDLFPVSRTGAVAASPTPCNHNVYTRVLQEVIDQQITSLHIICSHCQLKPNREKKGASFIRLAIVVVSFFNIGKSFTGIRFSKLTANVESNHLKTNTRSLAWDDGWKLAFMLNTVHLRCLFLCWSMCTAPMKYMNF